jgi:hypothetical protein
MSRQNWEEAVASSTVNGTAIANSTTEGLLFPSVNLPGGYMAGGRTLAIRAMGKLSNIVTTPGNLTFAIRWGGVAGTILAQTSALALNTTAQTDIMWRIEMEIITRADGSSGSLLAMGMVAVAQLATTVPNFMGSAGGASTNTPAAVTVDLTAATDLSLTAKFSIANAGNSITGMNYVLESLN